MPVDLVLLCAVLAVCIAVLCVCLAGRRKREDPELRRQLTDLRMRLDEAASALRSESQRTRNENLDRFRENREELSRVLQGMNQQMAQQALDVSASQRDFLTEVIEQLNVLRQQLSASAHEARAEQTQGIRLFEERLLEDTAKLTQLHRNQFEEMRREQENARKTQEAQLEKMRQENAARLDDMRQTVDEKLQKTVEQRFNDSFRVITDQLDKVHRGLGEMQELASGVGDLKRVLTNVKTRGTFGEIQLGALLEQFLAPGQFAANVHVRPQSAANVEFALKLPGGEDGETVYLPIDSKFPLEDYQRLVDARESGATPEEQDVLSRKIEQQVKKCAKDIHEKYICPPYTTDFAVMFVPTESLYAEILRRPDLFDFLQREHHVTVVGPANLAAFLNSLQMGFRTLAIQKRSGEVWRILGAVKREFSQFGDALEKTKQKLEEATKVVDRAGTRSRAIERQLQHVETLPDGETLSDRNVI